MKMLIAIECATWARSKSMSQDQVRRNSVAEILRFLADRLSNSGGAEGVATFTRPVGSDGDEIEVSYSFEREPAEEPAAAA